MPESTRVVAKYLTAIGLALMICFSQPCLTGLASTPIPQAACELVVLADANDPYYPLAEEIASNEGVLLAHTLDEALACQPTFLAWVAAPSSLSDAVMVDFGLSMKRRASVVSTGLITASTLELARDLWARASQVKGRRFVSVNGPNPAAHIEAGRITTAGGGAPLALTKTNLANALQEADYLTFTGHGSGRYLRLDEETEFDSADVPDLEGVVVSTASCQTLRLWNEESIARRFVDQGAAAYAGFVFSPNEGFLIGEFDGLPMRYTWPEFPIGHVVQVQNRGALQGFARFPFQFLLGDPRIALQPAPPYRLLEDRQDGSQRVLRLANVPAGVIPIRVSGGAAYRFVAVSGVAAAASADPFYNSRLQMVDIGADKFILLQHPGGEVTLSLRRQAPLYWFPLDVLLDSLDHTLVFAPQTGGDVLAAAFTLLPLAWLGWQLAKRRIDRQKACAALAFGCGAAVLHAAYAFVRLDEVTINSKALVFSLLGVAATLLLSAGGACMFFHARTWRGQAVGLLVLSFPSWASMLFGVGVVAAFNELAFRPVLGASLYNYAIGLLPGIVFVVTLIGAGLVLRALRPMKKAVKA